MHGHVLGVQGVEIPEEALRALRSQFMAIDKDGSGHIDSGELKSMFLVLGDAVSDTDIARMVAEADEDGDGKISFGEFCVVRVLGGMKAKPRLCEGGWGGWDHPPTLPPPRTPTTVTARCDNDWGDSLAFFAVV